MSTNRITQRGAQHPVAGATRGSGSEDVRLRARRLLEDPFSRMMRDPFDSESQLVGWYPAAEVMEKPDEFRVSLELAGMKASDVHVDFNEGLLTVRGEKSTESEEKDEDRKYHVWERSYGSFVRSFEFPNTVDADAVKAEFRNGVLEVHVPKRARGEPAGRRIHVAEKK